MVDQVESRQELRRTYTDIGVPIAAAARRPGKAILSMLPVAQQEYWLSRPIESVTPRTITDPDELRAELAMARSRGWAGSRSERTPGIRAVAAPIFDHSGAVIGALGLSVGGHDDRPLGTVARPPRRTVSPVPGLDECRDQGQEHQTPALSSSRAVFASARRRP